MYEDVVEHDSLSKFYSILDETYEYSNNESKLPYNNEKIDNNDPLEIHKEESLKKCNNILDVIQENNNNTNYNTRENTINLSNHQMQPSQIM